MASLDFFGACTLADAWVALASSETSLTQLFKAVNELFKAVMAMGNAPVLDAHDRMYLAATAKFLNQSADRHLKMFIKRRSEAFMPVWSATRQLTDEVMTASEVGRPIHLPPTSAATLLTYCDQ